MKEIESDIIELNLGPFNDCIDSIGDKCSVYTPSEEDEIFCYSGERSISRIGLLIGNDITVPMFTLGLAFDEDTPSNRDKLKRFVETRILTILFEMANKLHITLGLDNINIPIKSVCFEHSYCNKLCIAAELGIMVSKKKGE